MAEHSFLKHFEQNRRPPALVDPAIARQFTPLLRERVVASLQSFQLGEAAGGRIHAQVLVQKDAALDGAIRRTIQLYVEEEWRHAEELARVIRAIGAPLIARHWSNGAFTFCRRLLGFRIKLLTMAVAEVAGIVYYRALAERAGSSELGRVLSRIARDEEHHLDFQTTWFARVLRLTPRPLRLPYGIVLALLCSAILAAGVMAIWVEHRVLLRSLGVGLAHLTRGAIHELSSRSALFRRCLRQSPDRAELSSAALHRLEPSRIISRA